MKKVVKRLIAQAIAIAMTVQMVGFICPPFNSVKVYAENVSEQNINAEESDVADIAESQDDPTSSVEEEPQFEDMTVSNNLTLNAITEIQNLYISNGTLDLNGNTLVVHGDVIINGRGNLNFNKGELICNNFTMTNTYYGHYMYMQNPNDKLVVNGDFNFTGGYFSSSTENSGVIEVAGDVNITCGFTPSGNHKFILNGLDKQSVYINSSSCKFNILEIANTSDEGVVSNNSINANNITGSLNQLHYTFGGSVGTVIQDDSEINDNYNLAMGDLDLNGNTLIINGDFIQSGGNVILGGGHLIVNGDYLIQTENEDGSFSYSTGTLNMTNESDLVEVSGNFVMGSTKNHSELLTNGTLKIGGNFSQMNYGSDSAYNFKASGDHTTIINGKSKQSIKFDNPTYSSFLNISFENAAEISLDTNVYAYGKVKDEYTSVNGSYLYITKLSQIEGDCFGGNIYLTANNNADSHITKDLTIGNLSCDYLYLDEYKVSVNSLTVNSLLDIGNGYLETRNNLYISQYAYFKMNEPEAKVLVAGNLTFNSKYSSSNTLTNGTLEIKGDFIHNRNSEFICSGDHLTILSGKSASNGRSYIQTIAVYENGYKFNKLIATRPESLFNVKYYSTGAKTNFADICNEFSFEYDDIEPPSKVSGLTASETTADSIHLVWNSSDDNVRVTGYEIYRNGEKLITTGRTEYIDQSLSPNTSYSYQVYAFDEERNYSEGSEVLKTSTLEDTEAPDMPQNLKFSAVTGSSLTLLWNSSKDNIATAGYIIYRNNEEIARVKDCVFKDADLDRNIEYSYMIKAYDEAGNTSDFSDIITGSVVMPKITSLSPSDGSSLGGKTQIITVIFEKTGDGRGNNVTIGCKKAGENEYTLLTEEPLYAESYSANKLCVKYTWNTAGLDGNFDICATLYDSDGNTDVKEASYNVTSAGPKAPQELNAVTNNGTVELTWKKSVSADCVKYIIYRLDPNSEEYKEVAVINDRNTVRYIDKTVLAGEKYTYKISGVNSFDIEGEASNTAQIIVAEDKASPEIKAITADKSRLNKTAEIKVSAEDNLVVKSVKLEYKKADDEEYTLIGEIDCKNGVAIFNWDTVNIADGTYMLRATAFDANGNISVITDDSEREFTVDNTGISKITIDVENCTTASTHVSLRWNDVTEPDFGYFAVEQKQSDGSFKEVGKSTNVTGLHVQNLKPDAEYTFIVVGYDNI